jgi:DNA replication protein DnaC
VEDQTAATGFRIVPVDEGVRCEKCGSPVPCLEVWSDDRRVGRRQWKLCDVCDSEKTRKEESDRQAAANKELQLRLNIVSHPDKRLEGAIFESFVRGPHNSVALDVAEKWARTIQRPNLIIHGPVGCGKTFLARCAWGELVRKGIPCLWLNVAEMVEEAKKGFNDRDAGMKAQEARQYARNAPVLFLDDLGKNTKPGDGGWLEELLYSIVDPRYRYELPTVVTTEWKGSELISRVGESVVSRLADGAWQAGISKPAVPYRRPA